MSRSRQSRLAFVAGVAVLAWAGVALADLSPRQREFADREDGYFNQELATTNEKCGTKITAKIDWESFKEEIDKSLDGQHGTKYNFNSYCGKPLGEIWTLCEQDEKTKASIKKRIKSYTCKYGGKDRRKIALKGTSLTMWVDWEGYNYSDWIKAYLNKVL
jgi:hypothetical protein